MNNEYNTQGSQNKNRGKWKKLNSYYIKREVFYNRETGEHTFLEKRRGNNLQETHRIVKKGNKVITDTVYDTDQLNQFKKIKNAQKQPQARMITADDFLRR